MAPPLFGTVSEPSWPSTMPTWFVISSRELCKILDVTLQTLTEWRQRGIGPRPVPEGVYRPGVGRRKWYRLNEVMRWHDTLRGIDRETWEYDGRYLKKFLRTQQDLSEAQVESLKKLDLADLLPSFPQPRKR